VVPRETRVLNERSSVGKGGSFRDLMVCDGICLTSSLVVGNRVLIPQQIDVRGESYSVSTRSLDKML
jgi:hypothetical protein